MEVANTCNIPYFKQIYNYNQYDANMIGHQFEICQTERDFLLVM